MRVLLLLLCCGCFGRLNLPTQDELRPTLLKAFTFAQHGRTLSDADIVTLRDELVGRERDLFEKLLRVLQHPCPSDDRVCGAKKIEDLAELYRTWSDGSASFEVDLTAASALFFVGQSARQGGFDSNLARILIDEGVARVEALAVRHPKEPMVYGQRAFMYTFNEGKRNLVHDNISKCLELDPTIEWCRKLARRY